MSKEINKKEPLKSFINKVGTFRGKKYIQTSRPSSSDLKHGDSMFVGDESMFRMNNPDETTFPVFGGIGEAPNELDSTKLSGGSNNSNRDSYRLAILFLRLANTFDYST